MGTDPTRPTAAGVILLLALRSCASTRTPEADAASPPPSGPDVVRAPPDVAGYALPDSVQYPQPEIGTASRYRDSSYHVFDVDDVCKVRITNAQGEVTADEVRAFAEALLTAMAGDATSLPTAGARSVLRR